MESFLSSISSFLKLIPDHRPKNLASCIGPKSRVLYFPIDRGSFHNNQKLEKAAHGESNSNSKINCIEEVKAADVDLLPKFFATKTSSANLNSGYSMDSISSDTSHALEETDEETFLKSEGTEASVNSVASVCNKCQQNKRTETLQNESNSSPTLKVPYEPDKRCNETYMMKWDPSEINEDILHIVWPHRWEHDKDPASFFTALFQLKEEGFNFYVSVIGETFSEVPEIFTTAQKQLGTRVKAWGFQSRQDYLSVLDSAHVVVSTALHEFFGVSM
ncbi:glycosyltransferase-like domain-containing protein 1 [Plakobranchus ocellatus]|uniref:tRNA-queuosine alpha-mannosyltransferase n=1 Tax=Plakobranchus ocellatus TaxID=259542 RepID=A0AAV3XZI0_9GAST|nr:glycosyltransferase-like domain-containing protein 1 [Plakobranchus ocellatus]